MTFGESIKTCFSKYATFEGRATRSEYWWFWLLCFVCGYIPFVGWLFSLAALIPIIAQECAACMTPIIAAGGCYVQYTILCCSPQQAIKNLTNMASLSHNQMVNTRE